MWESLRDVLISPNVTIVLCFVLCLILIGIAMSKSGLMSIYTSAVQIGTADRERNVLRQQIEWIRMHCQGLETTVPKPDDYDPWRFKYVVSRVSEEYMDWVILNHITSNAAYIEIKQDRVVNLVSSLTTKAEFQTPEFQDYIRKDTKEVIQKLLQIRNIYK